MGIKKFETYDNELKMSENNWYGNGEMFDDGDGQAIIDVGTGLIEMDLVLNITDMVTDNNDEVYIVYLLASIGSDFPAQFTASKEVILFGTSTGFSTFIPYLADHMERTEAGIYTTPLSNSMFSLYPGSQNFNNQKVAGVCLGCFRYITGGVMALGVTGTPTPKIKLEAFLAKRSSTN